VRWERGAWFVWWVGGGRDGGGGAVSESPSGLNVAENTGGSNCNEFVEVNRKKRPSLSENNYQGAKMVWWSINQKA